MRLVLTENIPKRPFGKNCINLDLLKEQQQLKNNCCCSSKLELPAELPSIEETLKTLAGALEALKSPGLDKNDVFRYRCIITGAKVYKDLLSDYSDYRGLEAELLEAKEKYAEFSKKTQGIPPK